MNNNFTPEDLVQYLYRETNKDNIAAIEKAIATDWKLQEEYEALKEAKALLNKARYSPSKTSVRLIMEHSLKSKLLETSY